MNTFSVDQSVKEFFLGEEGWGGRFSGEILKGIFFTGLILASLADEALQSDELDTWSHYLDPAECRKFVSLILPKRRSEWLGGRLTAKFAAHLALRAANPSWTKNWSQLPIAYLTSGQPVLRLQNEKTSLTPHISISHSHGWAVAMSSLENPCGIDIELVSARILRVRERFCSQEEELILQPDMAELTLLWAAKEAIRKAAGGEAPPGFQNICLQEMIALPDGKRWLIFLVSRDREINKGKEKFTVGATFLDKHALAFTVRGVNSMGADGKGRKI